MVLFCFACMADGVATLKSCSTFCFLRVIREILFIFKSVCFPTMNSKNYNEDLGSVDSHRSISSEDLQEDEVSDLFDHSAEVHSSDRRENPRDLATTSGEGVSASIYKY